MNKIYSVLGSGMIAFTLLTSTVSANSGLNTSETTLVEYLDNFSYKYNGKEFTITDDLLTKVKGYLISDGVELNDEQVNKVTKLAEEALISLAKKGALSGSDLTKEQGESFINDYITPIATELNLKVEYDPEALDVTITDANGNVVYGDSTTEEGDNDGDQGAPEEKPDETPERPTPEEPSNPETPEVPEEPSNPEKPEETPEVPEEPSSPESSKPIEDKEDEKLPQTGSVISSTGVAILSTLMVAGGILLNKKK